MKPADEQLAEVLARTPMTSPRIPVYSNVDAAPHSDPDDIRRTLVAQVLQGVRWEDSMRRMIADGFDTFYEIGPGRVLTGLLKRIDRKTPCTSIPRGRFGVDQAHGRDYNLVRRPLPKGQAQRPRTAHLRR